MRQAATAVSDGAVASINAAAYTAQEIPNLGPTSATTFDKPKRPRPTSSGTGLVMRMVVARTRAEPSYSAVSPAEASFVEPSEADVSAEAVSSDEVSELEEELEAP